MTMPFQKQRPDAYLVIVGETLLISTPDAEIAEHVKMHNDVVYQDTALTEGYEKGYCHLIKRVLEPRGEARILAAFTFQRSSEES